MSGPTTPLGRRELGMRARLGTLMTERLTEDALAVAEQMAESLEPLGDLSEQPDFFRFVLDYARLLFRRGGPGDAERGRDMILALADSSTVKAAVKDPVPLLRQDDARARALPSIVVSLNHIGQHRRAGRLAESLLRAHAAPSARFHAAALNAAVCWTAEGVADWCMGRAEEAVDSFARSVTLLEGELDAGAPHVVDTDPSVRDGVLLLRESNLLYSRLWQIVAGGNADLESVQAEIAAANSLLDRSEANPTVAPMAVTLRHGRLAEALTELAILQEREDPGAAAETAMSAVIYFAWRWEIYRRDNDLTTSFVYRYSEANRIAGSPGEARDVLERGLGALAARYGPDHDTLPLIRRRLAAF